MKTQWLNAFLSVLTIFTLSLTATAAPVNFGNDQPLSGTTTYVADYLLGIPVTITQDTFITHFGSTYNQAGSQVQFALYADNSNAPGDLIATSVSHTTSLGINEIAVDTPTQTFTLGTSTYEMDLPISLSAGNYWIMAIYDQDTLATIGVGQGSSNIHYISQSFDSPLPATFPPSHNSYDTGGLINYFVVTDDDICVKPRLVVPEPASLSLIALSSLLLLRRERNRA
ncbi:hypothetical protein KS4_01090 [Poriferisphaera corsica]|uniref:PEP-CTERM protein-sorting domain-containing protein n=1 Tax=Poriferisphaera corsica TaxID=2528020 RepID=A0A517YPD4_9BACT|nr:hypothetical protein [Poriferisphaera corsica]QDU32080.1 hypothetical protein KS4_01090 [Poriferisphaera corsica]